MSNSNTDKQGDVKFFDRTFWVSFAFFLGAVGIVLLLPFLLTQKWKTGLDFSDTGTSEIGDTIGGIMGPFIGIIGSALTFLAFWVQYKTNEIQKEQFEKAQKKIEEDSIEQKAQFEKAQKKTKEDSIAQEKIWKKERFEQRFYELLKLHRANVDEMSIEDRVKGRKCFIQLFEEFKFCFSVLKIAAIEIGSEIKTDDKNLQTVAYNVFFYGISTSNEANYLDDFNPEEKKLFEHSKKYFIEIQKKTKAYFGINPKDSFFEYRNNKFTQKQWREQENTNVSHRRDLKIENKSKDNFKVDQPRKTKDRNAINAPTTNHKMESIKFFYVPFEGHLHNLGHYYRHLLQTANYIISINFLDDDEKEKEIYAYMKILRAQLPSYEQLLLYYNATVWYPKEWGKILTDYRLIKNIPLALANFGITPENYYEADIERLKQKSIAMFDKYEK